MKKRLLHFLGILIWIYFYSSLLSRVQIFLEHQACLSAAIFTLFEVPFIHFVLRFVLDIQN